MLGRKLACLIIVISFIALTVFTVGCSPEEKAEDEQDKNEKEEFKDELSRKESRIENLEQ